MRESAEIFILNRGLFAAIEDVGMRYAVPYDVFVTKKRFNNYVRTLSKYIKKTYKQDISFKHKYDSCMDSKGVQMHNINVKIIINGNDYYEYHLQSFHYHIDDIETFKKTFIMYKEPSTVRKDYLKEVEKFIEE